MANYRGLSEHEEVASSRRRVDTRSAGAKLAAWLETGQGALFGLMAFPALAILTLRLPFSGELLVLAAWLYYRRYLKVEGRQFEFPYRVPLLAKVRDGSANGKLGEGLTYLGSEIGSNEEVYASNSDLRTHQLVLGTTGSGKTEYLLGIVANALVQNSGFIYIDGKGDPKLQKDVFRLMREFGREDDLLVINFITSGRDFIGRQEDQLTNTLNPMAVGSSGMLIELIVSLMDDSGGGADMWKGRAMTFVAAQTRLLVYLRDLGHLVLDSETFIEYFDLGRLEELVWGHNGRYGADFDTVAAPMRAYFTTLPGYRKEDRGKQDAKALEQHGYITMQLTRIFNDLAFNYGHIFKVRVGEVDIFDVVYGRRCLVVLLPALERAPESLKMLGKLIVGSVKQMMAGALGNRIEGMVREIIDSRPTNAAVPYYTIFDEAGYYIIPGTAVMPAQARSLSFSMTFAGQDFSSFKKASAEEAEAIWENTNIRAVGRMTGGRQSDTWQKLSEAAGEAYETVIGGYEAQGDGYKREGGVKVEKRGRLDYDDLAQQENGEFTFLVGKKSRKGGGVRVIRSMAFYTASDPPREMRTNGFLPIEPPSRGDADTLAAERTALAQALEAGEFAEQLQRERPDPVLLELAELLDQVAYAGHQLLQWLQERADSTPEAEAGQDTEPTVEPFAFEVLREFYLSEPLPEPSTPQEQLDNLQHIIAHIAEETA
ncbi:TraM recognition domain-containing protein [Parachitinimonas caeni]|uniref:TraM recognition domain-containing protein n=1 Tax=Parachitinimonas caeni TaxID=3031301 RepID=A0ABT7DWI5_9NEIS|nr:TraM recognition domain-containing protein [Parachitinimonas caeni]MDK2124410.1 TraM recognition domain-containing protein [Parachitinimonas caeni]